MKPQNQQQREVVELSKTLPYISDAQGNWAFENCLEKYAVRSRKTLFCLECGHSWKDESFLITSIDGCTCPSCNYKLTMYNHTASNYKSNEYFAIITTVGEYQVVRMAMVSKLMKKNEAAFCVLNEVMQHWIGVDGKIITLSKTVQGLTGYYDSWVLSSDLEIRQKSQGSELRAGISPYKIYPTRKISSLVKRNGFKGRFYGHTPHEFFSLVLKNPRVETLIKSKQLPLLKSFDNDRVTKYWNSIKICIRNNYIIEDGSLWFDYIQLLDYFQKDLNSSKYVCPMNLIHEHDRLVSKKRDLLKRMKLNELREKIELSQVDFEQQKSHFFGLIFQEDNIQIKVIDSVQGFLEEGDILNHCVFTNQYYKRKNSLIFSALVDSEPAETIEIDLETLKIKQARGKGNKATPHHKKIVEIVEKNIFQIQKIAEKQIA